MSRRDYRRCHIHPDPTRPDPYKYPRVDTHVELSTAGGNP